MENGIVYLVGAGPGDPKLITVRGLQCIEACDVVVYDRLASPRLLKHLKPGAERVYVGKLPDRHTMKQEEINQLLVDLALQGKIVTRLKGGDPTIFGRVGEEAGLLREHGIPFEIVPGITSAIAVPAYAGIPVTHRDLASSMSIITGHESPDKLDRSIHWDKVTLATGTLVFLMGVSKIGYISEQLIRHGKPASTPVALIRWGTRAEQQTLVGTLETIESQVLAANFQPPAVIVVGEVVRQREQLMWYERKPLFGTRILVTRARAQASRLAEQIEELGGEPVEYPVIEMRANTAASAAVQEAVQAADSFDWLIFTSSNGVDYFFRWLRELRVDIRRFHRARLAAVGPGTAKALLQYGLIADELPQTYQAEGLAAQLAELVEPGQRALLPRGDLARDVLPQELGRAGVDAVALPVYETVLAQTGEDDEVLRQLMDKEIDVITFTSSSTVTNLLERLRQQGVEAPAELLAGITAACIGPVTAATAREAGLEVALEPEEATVDALLSAIATYRHNQR
ncbi:uroporphyrinogen-III C-methyltransferase [Paenibacillus daejeonensis]|uniref:uroporphyrinogen-III C-methyltransferase n=1 Tax=Paenibacillus daejeonensis TaxID=135193 RepID=UPI00035DC56B|nr:uroporphyrinogen-III C-methyltransferase [Paenibacillus daejeonensis]